eukprot:3002-Chlamydomonas_euryale.AAC.3
MHPRSQPRHTFNARYSLRVAANWKDSERLAARTCVWTDGHKDRQWIDGQTEGQTDRRVDRLTVAHAHLYAHASIDVRTDGRHRACMDGCGNRQVGAHGACPPGVRSARLPPRHAGGRAARPQSHRRAHRAPRVRRACRALPRP